MHADFPLSRLSSAARCALQGMAYLAGRPAGSYCLVDKAAGARGLPGNFLSKIFQRLARRGLLVPRRGPGGGYALSSPAHRVPLAEVVKAVEESPRARNRCILGFRACGGNRHCAVHRAALRADESLWKALRRTTLAELERGINGPR